MPHTALTDEQILILRLANSDAASGHEEPQVVADLAILRRLGYLEKGHKIALTSAGRTVLESVDRAWNDETRTRVSG